MFLIRMPKLVITVFCIAVMAQTLLAQPLEVNGALSSSAISKLQLRDVVDPLSEESESGPSLFSHDIEESSDQILEAAVDEVLSRVRRGLRSRLKRVWKKHIRPVVKKAVVAHVVKTVVPVAVGALG